MTIFIHILTLLCVGGFASKDIQPKELISVVPGIIVQDATFHDIEGGYLWEMTPVPAHLDAEGFIKLNALRLRLAAKLKH